jgi:hypothetical protein
MNKRKQRHLARQQARGRIRTGTADPLPGIIDDIRSQGAEVYDGRRWLKGEAAVRHVQGLHGDDPARVIDEHEQQGD